MTDRRIAARMERARRAGSWMPWAAGAAALVGWGGAAALAWSTLGPDRLLALDPLTLAGGAMIALAPGLALITAGFMARESKRSSEANALVLSSARLLLTPAESSRDELASVASVIAREAEVMNEAVARAEARFSALRTSVDASIGAALKAAETMRTDSDALVARLGGERDSFVHLAEALRSQSEALADAIPRYARTVSDAAQSAQHEVASAEETLDQRLRGMEDAARRLGDRVDQLDTMGAESRKRAMSLIQALSALDDHLKQSGRIVEDARRAGELAAGTARTTAGALSSATFEAMEQARRTSEEISEKAQAAAALAQAALDRLKSAGVEAEATIRSAGLAARAQADDTEQRVNRLASHLFNAVARATHIAEAGIETARRRIPEDPAAFDPLEVEDAPPFPAAEPEPAEPPRPAFHKPTASAAVETAMRDAVTPARILEGLNAKPRPNGDRSMTSPAIPLIPPRGEPISAPAALHFPPIGEAEPADEEPLSWRDLLNGLDGRDPAPDGDPSTVLLKRLADAGVRLSDAVKAQDLRRIASAAHLGERQRRRAIRDVAPGEIQRVVRLLEDDRDLEAAARRFVAAEEPAVLRLLSGAERVREDADPRLSAYLFLDAALGSVV